MAVNTSYSTVADNRITYNNATWATARASSTGTISNVTDTTANVGVDLFASDNTYYIRRFFMFFVTQGAGTVTSATFTFQCSTTPATTVTLHLCESNQSSTVANGDFDLITLTSFGSVSFSTTGVKTITVNAAGITYLNNNLNSTIKLALTGSHDLDNSAPVGNTTYYAAIYTGNEATQAKPTLNLTYTPNARELNRSAMVVDPHCDHYWQLEGNSTATVGAVSGTDTAITYSAANGYFSQGAGFNGTTSRIALNNTMCDYGSGDFALYCWVKITANNADYMLFGKDDAGTDRQFILDKLGSTGAGKIRFLYHKAADTSTYFETVTDAAQITDILGWHMIVAQRVGSNLDIYIDGAVVASTDLGSAAAMSSQKGVLYLGRRGYSGSEAYFAGQMDDAAIYSRSFTAAEIAALYNGTYSHIKKIAGVPWTEVKTVAGVAQASIKSVARVDGGIIE